MHAFEFYQPTAITFGPGTEGQAGPKAAQLGARRVLVVYGGESARRSGLLTGCSPLWRGPAWPAEPSAASTPIPACSRRGRGSGRPWTSGPT